jgi:hypothetical protein
VTALGDARQAVAASLADVGAPVFDQPPGSLQPPCVVLLPGQPWIVPRGGVTLDVVAYANPAGGNSTALTVLEGLIEAVRGALWAHGLAPGETGQPIFDPDAGVLSASTPVTIRTVCK